MTYLSTFVRIVSLIIVGVCEQRLNLHLLLGFFVGIFGGVEKSFYLCTRFQGTAQRRHLKTPFAGASGMYPGRSPEAGQHLRKLESSKKF